tara:strand:- start:1805 stop:1969 length:165 start_codon:yes stop_codon:yes gene_type:complete
MDIVKIRGVEYAVFTVQEEAELKAKSKEIEKKFKDLQKEWQNEIDSRIKCQEGT